MAQHGTSQPLGWEGAVQPGGGGCLGLPFPIAGQTEAFGTQSWLPAQAMLSPELCGDHSMMVADTRTTSPINLILPTSHYAQAKEMSHPSVPRKLVPPSWSLVTSCQGVPASRIPLFTENLALGTGQERAPINRGSKSSAKHYMMLR